MFTKESRWQEQVAFEALNIRNTLGKHMLTTLPKYWCRMGSTTALQATLTSAVHDSASVYRLCQEGRLCLRIGC